MNHTESETPMQSAPTILNCREIRNHQAAISTPWGSGAATMTDTTQTLAEFLSHKSSVEGGLSDYLIELQDFLVEHPNPSDKQQDMFCAGVGEDFGSEPQIRAKALLEMEAERRAKVSV